MPATQARVRWQLEEHEQQRADVEVRQLAVDRRHDEEGRRKQETGKRAARGSLKQGRAVGHKGLKASGLGEDFSNSGSAGTVEHQARQTKSEVTKWEANEAWEEMKKGRAPMGYILVSAIFVLVSTITDDYDRKTTGSVRGRTQEAGMLLPAE